MEAVAYQAPRRTRMLVVCPDFPQAGFEMQTQTDPSARIVWKTDVSVWTSAILTVYYGGLMIYS